MFYAGMKVVVCRPTPLTRVRSWRERLFSLPWKPLTREETSWREPVVKPEECYTVAEYPGDPNGILYCGEKFYDRLKAAIGQLGDVPRLGPDLVDE